MKVKVVKKAVLIALESELDVAAVHDALCAVRWCYENNWPNFNEAEKKYASRIDQESLDYLIKRLFEEGENLCTSKSQTTT